MGSPVLDNIFRTTFVRTTFVRKTFVRTTFFRNDICQKGHLSETTFVRIRHLSEKTFVRMRHLSETTFVRMHFIGILEPCQALLHGLVFYQTLLHGLVFCQTLLHGIVLEQVPFSAFFSLFSLFSLFQPFYGLVFGQRPTQALKGPLTRSNLGQSQNNLARRASQGV